MEKSTYQRGGRSDSGNDAKVACLASPILLIVAVAMAGFGGLYDSGAAAQSSYRISMLAAGSNPVAAKIGDLDGDGCNDIAVVNLQGSLQLFFNNGAGSFARSGVSGLWPSGSQTLDLDIGDLNGDGRNDIAVAFSTPGGSISVLLNQGNRAFAVPANFPVCSGSQSVAIGDLDGDGDADLADVSQCAKAGILLNQGGGSFTLRGAFGDGNLSRSIALADINGDGFDDIAYVNHGLAYITVMLNNRDATFAPHRWYYVGDLPEDLTVGDFDNDGDIDIGTANAYYDQVFVLINGGAGTFISYSELPGGDAPNAIASADFNNDGRLDYATVSWGTNSLSVFLNQGYYSYSGPARFTVGQSPTDVVAGDLDGDSLLDIVTVNRGGGGITLLTTSGSVAAPPPPSPPPAQITLTLSKRTVRRETLVDLRWSGVTGSTVDLYRNGSRFATVSNTGSYTNNFSSRTHGTFAYKVCAAGTQTCSNQSSISF